MRAWLMDGYEGVERLRLGEVPDPQPGPVQVLLRVKFAALNPADAFLARKMYPANPSLPHILGRDGVGDVIAVGSGVGNVRLGETLGILCCEVGVEMWGTLAEKVVVPVESVTRIPTGWSCEEMAGAPLVFLTAWQAKADGFPFKVHRILFSSMTPHDTPPLAIIALFEVSISTRPLRFRNSRAYTFSCSRQSDVAS